MIQFDLIIGNSTGSVCTFPKFMNSIYFKTTGLIVIKLEDQQNFIILVWLIHFLEFLLAFYLFGPKKSGLFFWALIDLP